MKEHIPFNRSVYFGQSKCNFVPNCAFESQIHFNCLPNGSVIRIYESDDKQHKRIVYFPNRSAIVGCCGILYNKQGEIIYVETNKADRNKGIFKQLKAYIFLEYKTHLFYQYASEAMQKAAKLA